MINILLIFILRQCFLFEIPSKCTPSMVFIIEVTFFLKSATIIQYTIKGRFMSR